MCCAARLREGGWNSKAAEFAMRYLTNFSRDSQQKELEKRRRKVLRIFHRGKRVPITCRFYWSIIQLRCHYTHLTTKSYLSPSELVSFRHSKIARITRRYMDLYKNIDVFRIYENICSISLFKKRFTPLIEVRWANWDYKNGILPSFKKKYLIKTSQNSTFLEKNESNQQWWQF